MSVWLLPRGWLEWLTPRQGEGPYFSYYREETESLCPVSVALVENHWLGFYREQRFDLELVSCLFLLRPLRPSWVSSSLRHPPKATLQTP